MTVARSPELELRALIAELTRARPESIDPGQPDGQARASTRCS
jgi:hypothetical protein